jgi:hypothetical protein
MDHARWLARAAVGASLLFSGCDGDPAEPHDNAGTLAAVELNGTRFELYTQSLTGSGRERIHFDGADDPFPENSPLVPPFTDANVIALGPMRWSADGERLALVATLAFDQSEVVIIDRNSSKARVSSPNTQIILSDPEWSADGRQIAYAMSTLPHARGVELFVTDLVQNRIRKVTAQAGWTVLGAGLRFSHDAGQLFYSRTSGQAVGTVPNYTSELRAVDLSSGQLRTLVNGLIGEVNAIAADGSWVLLLRNAGILGNGRYDRQLIRRSLTTGQENVLVNNGDIQYARLLPGDQEALVVTDVSTSSQHDYRYGTVAVSGGSLRPVIGTGAATRSVAVHPFNGR